MGACWTAWPSGTSHPRWPRPLPEAVRLRQLRLSRVARDQLRVPRVCQFLPQAVLPCGVHCRAAEQPAHGFLRTANPHCRRAAARRQDPWRRYQRQRRQSHAGGGRRCARRARARPERAAAGDPARLRQCATWATTSESGGRGPPLRELDDLVRRVRVPLPALEALATAGAFGCLGLGRREALWAVGALADPVPTVPGTTPGGCAGATAHDADREDLRRPVGDRLVADSHPVQHVRSHWTTGERCRLRQLRHRRARRCWSVGSSPTVSGRRPPGESSS